MITELPYLYLTTTGWKSGRPQQIEIWFTALGGRYYLIAEKGERAHWVQNVKRNPFVTFRVGDQSFRATARAVDRAREPAFNERLSALSRAKYGWGEGLVVELAPDEAPREVKGGF